MSRGSVVIAAACALVAGASTPVAASCGLAECPTHAHGDLPWCAGVTIERAAYALDGLNGAYRRATARIEYAGWRGWHVAGLGGVALVTGDTGHHTGPTNPVLMAQRGFALGAWGTGALGVQAEVPLGDHHDGLASPHAEGLPYLSVAAAPDRVGWFALAGFRRAVETGHDREAEEPEALVLVNPHADREFVARAGAGVRRGAWSADVAADLQQPLGGDDRDSRVTTGVTAGWAPRPAFAARVRAEIPLTRDRFYTWRAGVTTEARF